MADIADMLWEFDDYLWFIPFILIASLGIYATIKFKGIQFTCLKEMCKITFSREKKEKKSVTPFHVFCLSIRNSARAK